MHGQLKPNLFGVQLKRNVKALRDGDRSRLPWIFCVFTENHARSKLLAAKALRDAIDSFSFKDITRIEEQVRQTSSMTWGINWHALDIAGFFTFQMDDADRRAVCIFASFNPNGFIREKAVHMLQEFDGTLPYILLRLNDWVSQVRQTASAAFSFRLQRLSKGELLTALPFAEKLKGAGRGDHDVYIQRISSVLTAPEHAQDLRLGLDNANVKTRRICTDALFSASPPKVELALERLYSEPEPFLRAGIFQKLNNLGQRMDDAAGVFLNDKYPLNRILAFQYIQDTGHDRVWDIAVKLLLDRSSMIREAAQNALTRQNPTFDFRAFYRGNLTQYPAIAINELGGNGIQSDTEEISEYLEDERGRVVKSAMAALMRLDSEKYSPVITEMLADARPGIVKTARNLIVKHGRPDFERVWEILQNTPWEDTQSKCTDILFTATKWPRLIYMLEALVRNDAHSKAKALDGIKRWVFHFNRSFVIPSSEQSMKIRSLIMALPGVLSPGLERELLFLVS